MKFVRLITLINGSQIYELWYQGIMDCIYKTETYSNDKRGFVKSFDSTIQRYVLKPFKPRTVNPHKPWWDQECCCQDAVDTRHECLQQLKEGPSRENLCLYREDSSISRKTIARRKRINFRNFVESIESMRILESSPSGK